MATDPAVPTTVYPTEIKLSKKQILQDFRLCCLSREASLLARKEVLTGKAKFGITGDGKEVPQVAMAHAFKQGDFRSGYYRDQTLLMALDMLTLEEYFAQLYADPKNDTFGEGRQMLGHFGAALLDENGDWLKHTEQYNISADISCTAGQMARGLGLALASKQYRELKEELPEQHFSKDGNEVVFCTIGDASTSEGVFWESLNAAGVQQVPMLTSVWDDGYGISVPKKYQTTKSNISDILAGFHSDEDRPGVDIYTAKGWDYANLVDLYQRVTRQCRELHRPCLVHVEELTQPQGHSTSGSHERYKSKERLEWEREWDCILMMEKWMHQQGIATEAQTEEIRKTAKQEVRAARDTAWKNFNAPTQTARETLITIYQGIPDGNDTIVALKQKLQRMLHPVISDLVRNAQRCRFALQSAEQAAPIIDWLKTWAIPAGQHYHKHLHSTGSESALNIPVVAPVYGADSKTINGYKVLNRFFDQALSQYPILSAFGEDVGKIGDVNQGFAGMQEKHGETRVFDTGIREWTIVGQAIGMAMRGLRPIAEIQYLDYIIYGIEPLMDDLATLRWRSAGKQKAPAIIRTRGHRLEGIWHAGSPMGTIVHSLRGMWVCTPRNMVQAVGMYRTLLQSDEPALVIECLNGYRLKEQLPDNFDTYTVPLGVPEVLQEGTDITLVTYGSCVRVAQEACNQLMQIGINVELIDVQTLLPFDLEHRILQSVQKTNRLMVLDEDVPGGASAFILQEILERQDAYQYLDSKPQTITAYAHRTAYGNDGDYFTKPNTEDIYFRVYQMMREVEPARFPEI